MFLTDWDILLMGMGFQDILLMGMGFRDKLRWENGIQCAYFTRVLKLQ